MCRIAGIINKLNKDENLYDLVKAMTETMAHGGPDDEGYFINLEKNIAFGHKRLALLDLSPAGHQPMQYEDGRFTITFNGEVYNYLALKTELTDFGFTFSSNSDTEIILAAFAQWGVNSFQKLEGMFALALYDKEKEVCYLVRDSAGIKPLYFSHVNQQLVFASEVKAFHALPYAYQANPSWKIYFLAFGHIPEPYTTCEEIQMLPKGHYLKYALNDNSCEIQKFGSVHPTELIATEKEAVEKIQRVLYDSVKTHMMADAEIGIFLSGGIDSSILSLIADEIQKEGKIKKLNTLSINFEESNYSEKKYQDCIVSKIDTNHAEYTITEDFFKQHFNQALQAMDQPTTDGINSWFVNYSAKQNHLKAVLSGIGADELFGGYPSFKRIRLIQTLSALPKSLLKLGLHFKHAGIKRSYYLRYKNTAGKYLFLRGIFTPDEIADILNCSIKQVDTVLSNIKFDELPAHLTAKEQASWLELNLYMQNQLLKDTDTMSMQHGIEVRLPFLDKKLISLVQSVPSRFKYKTKQPKAILIAACSSLLPKKIWNRPKMGFTFPLQQWLQKELATNKNALLSNNPKASELLDEFIAGKIHWSKALALHLLYVS
ncbi:asparagine synthase (glutamine-hydrolyzing) [Pedobacter sp. MW01-1-1]|uniref:asparagine synthase (glutamine-hydrolyzing) n=1 Tax=Pedobacter sp. MW01-1-1 TaxID=3383027 RepID=UPI003FEF4684